MDRVEPNIDGYSQAAYHAPAGANVYRRRRPAAQQHDADGYDAYDDTGYNRSREPHDHDHDRHNHNDHDHYSHDQHGDDQYDHARFGIIDRILAAPGKWVMGGLTAAAFALIGVNAAFMQPGAHPAPIAATRAAAPADAIPASRLPTRPNAVTLAPAPIVPPDRVINTASIADLQQARDAQSTVAAVRAPLRVPSPVPRPRLATAPVASTPAPAPAQVAQSVVPQPAIAQPAAALIPPAPVQAQGQAQIQPRPVQTIAIDDPIGALLTPSATVGQPLPQPSRPQASGSQASAQPVVAAVQSILADLGYTPGSIDGVIGPSTEEAIRRFQLRRALEPNGQITSDLLREIERVSGTLINS